jgi:hypothetical protein
VLGLSCVFATVNTLQIVLAATVTTTTTNNNNNNFKRRKYYLFADCHVSDLLVIKYSAVVFVVIYSQIIKLPALFIGMFIMQLHTKFHTLA